MRKQNITTQITPFHLSEKDELAMKWQTLETRANNTVFLSWLWIGRWLAQVVDDMFVIEAYQNGQVVGLGIFVEKKRRVLGLFPIKQWFLHRTGNIKQDQIWIEHNDFLLASSIADDVRNSMVEALFNHSNKLQEVIIGLSSRKVQDDFHRYFSESSILIQSLGYEVNLSAIEKNYLQEVLSKNTRSQINRSNKILNELGDLVFRVVTDKNEIKYLYKDIAKIHIERWGNTAEGSGFTNDEFLTFHQQLLDKSDKNTVQIAVLSLNNSPIGYLVNFVYKQKTYFYLSALTSFDNNKIKVGLTLHEKTISYYREQGLKSYDFLAGEARYKASMSKVQYVQSMKSFNQYSLILTSEKMLKSLKMKCTYWLSKCSR